MHSEAEIYMKNVNPDISYYIQDKGNGTWDIINNETDVLITNTANINPTDLEITTMEFAEVDTFVEELFHSEPLWDGTMAYAKVDSELGFLFNVTVTLLISPGDRDGSALKKCWIAMLTRLGILVGGHLATDSDRTRWNERIDRLFMPVWLKLTA